MNTTEIIEKLIQRIEASGDAGPGAFNLAADLIEIVAVESSRCLIGPGLVPTLVGNMMRLQADCAKGLQSKAASLASASWSVSTGPPKLSTG